MKSIVWFKKYMINIGIFYIIKNKFIYKKYLDLIILFVINKSLEMDFYKIILSLVLAISLKIKRCWKLLLYSKKNIYIKNQNFEIKTKL